jgi:hypothetical protein
MPIPSERAALVVRVFRKARSWQCEVLFDRRPASTQELGVDASASEAQALASARRIFRGFEEVIVLRIPDR